MRVLLDNCIDRNFAKHIADHAVVAAADIGWGALENGKLLSSAAARFDVLVTVDKNIRFQQNLVKLPLPVIELDAVRNRIDDLAPFAQYLSAALERSKRFRFVGIKSDGSMECLAERVPDEEKR
jgi:hypothetical protein